MRTVNFKSDVLWAVADKMGLDPEQSNFLTNQAIPIGKSIDQWVRRVYDARDWPELTLTDQFAPASHIVPYDYVPSGIFNATPKTIGRVIKVFLVDPDTTDAPIDTDFTLQDRGVHVGYDHGTTVWIRYITPPPRFTAVQWSSSEIYAKDDVVYSYRTGECYRSRVNNNLGHDPATAFSVPPHQINDQDLPPAPVVITQERTPPNVGSALRNEILVISFSDAITGTTPTDPPEAGTDFNVSCVRRSYGHPACWRIAYSRRYWKVLQLSYPRLRHR